MKVSVSLTINAAHQLYGTRLHGHTYRITATIQGEKDPASGRVVSFEDLQHALRETCRPYDHDRLERCLSELPATAENLAIAVARGLCKRFTRIVDVSIAVGDDGVATTEMYQRDDGEYFSR